MKHRPVLRFIGAMAAFCAFAPWALGQEQAASPSMAAAPGVPGAANTDKDDAALRIHPLYVDAMAATGFKSRSTAAAGGKASANRGSAATSSSAAETFSRELDGDGDNDNGQTLPLFTFHVKSSRDGNRYLGSMVGKNPFKNPGTVHVPTKVIPLIIKTQMAATSFNSTTGLFTTEPGNTTFDPTAADDVCLSKPNDVPLTLMKESPPPILFLGEPMWARRPTMTHFREAIFGML